MSARVKTSYAKINRSGLVGLSVNKEKVDNLCVSCERNIDGSCPVPRGRTPDRPCVGCFPYFSESRCAGCPILPIRTYRVIECAEYTMIGNTTPLHDELLNAAIEDGI